ncbi:MAG TPA: glycosyltransferase [Sphingopyxis sp.]|nr:glycosyltransferase [Sphingopyxis sp.]HMP44155.1 glycosyltransferase [Sphingopyxis sp.]HMQ19301.1 glycosyltransferase [Sphingopyxis sp.]
MTEILLLNPSFRLEQGGPAYSVGRLGVALAALGHRVTVWAADGSAGAVRALDPDAGIILSDAPIAELLGEGRWDIVHDNGLWLPYGARVARLCRARAIPRLLSVRGMLQPWAWNHRRWKKRIAWAFYQRRGLESAARLHATSEEEVARIRELFPARRPLLIANGIDIPDLPTRAHPPEGEPRIALFLGRLHPVKGLAMLVEAWARLRPAGWKLRLVGPDEDGYRAELEAQITAAGLSEHVAIAGPASGAEKQAHFAAASLFLLPSYTENFGIAAAEALAHGLPVVTTTGTPWRVLEEQGCGWWVAPETDAIAAALDEATALPDTRLAAMGATGRSWVADHLHWPAIAKQFSDAYAVAIANPAPA